MSNSIEFKRLTATAKIPTRATAGSAGWDIYADCAMFLKPGESAAVSTGFAMSMPFDMEAQIRPRSGLAAKRQVTVLNAPGTIDSDFTQEVKVILINHGEEIFHIHVGDRVAQMVFAKVLDVQVLEVAEISDPGTRNGGFGSTGV